LFLRDPIIAIRTKVASVRDPSAAAAVGSTTCPPRVGAQPARGALREDGAFVGDIAVDQDEVGSEQCSEGLGDLGGRLRPICIDNLDLCEDGLVELTAQGGRRREVGGVWVVEELECLPQCSLENALEGGAPAPGCQVTFNTDGYNYLTNCLILGEQFGVVPLAPEGSAQAPAAVRNAVLHTEFVC
jgi:hypothetical protein